MRGYEIMSETMEELGLDPVFGNPGSTEIPMLRGFGNYMLTLHDSLAVGMADGSSQMTGKPAMVNLHTLPGVANAMAFIHTAKQNRAPVIVTAGQQDSRHAFYEPFLWHDLKGLVGEAVKYRYEVTRAGDIERAMKKAYSISLEPPRGPVFLSFPMDVLDLDAEYSRLPVSIPNVSYVDGEAVKYVSRCLEESKNPAFIMGSEMDAYGQLGAAVEFAEKMGYPVFAEPFASRSPFRSDSSVFSGDLLPATSAMNMSLLSHDLVVNFGGDLTMYPYLPSPLLPGKKIITVSLSPENRHGEYIRSSPWKFMQELSKLAGRKGNFSRPHGIQSAGRAARERRAMGPSYVLSRASKVFHDHVIVDEGISSSPLVRSIFGYRDGSYFTSRTGQLGWGMPAAAGMAMHRDKVLLVVGDGALMYSVQMLWTVAAYKLPVKMLVLDNEGYTILKSFSQSYYPDVAGVPYFSFKNNIEDVARSFGIEARTASQDLSEMEWLREGKQPRMLVCHVQKSVPRMFP